MAKLSFSPDTRLVLDFNEDRLDPARALWFLRFEDEANALPCNGIAWRGSDFEELTWCRDFFANFPAVFLALADYDLREGLADAFEQYLPQVRVFLPADHAFDGVTSICNLIKAAGPDAGAAIDALCAGAYERPAYGLLNIADVRRTNRSQLPTVLSGFAEFDRAMGGFAAGELSVWTGRRGEGKSTLLSQMLLEAVDQRHRVCAFSGELDAWRFKSWAMLQAAGPQHIVEEINPRSGKTFYRPTDAAVKAINSWWDGALYLYDNRIAGATEADKILTVFGIAVLRYGCDVFLVDNLMTTDFSTKSDGDFYRAQSVFVGRLVDFAKRNGVHVHLVAHPRKQDKQRGIMADDIGGSSGIVDRADNVFALTRLTSSEATEKGYDAKLRVLKNRADGVDATFSLRFEHSSRRFYKAGSGDPNRRYSWDTSTEPMFAEIPEDPNSPF